MSALDDNDRAVNFGPANLDPWEGLTPVNGVDSNLRVAQSQNFESAALKRIDADEIRARREHKTRGGSGGADLGSEPNYGPPDNRPEIELSTDEAAIADAVINLGIATDPNIYQRGGRLCRIASVKKITRTSQGESAQELPGIIDEEAAALRSRLTRLLQFMRLRKNKDGTTDRISAHPPRWIVDDVLTRRSWPTVRVLEAITEVPVLRCDGTILNQPGYDAQTGLYYAPACDFGEIADKPSRADAVHAIGELKEVFEDFPFQEPMHRSAALAMLLTLFARHAIGDNPTPLGMVDKNIRGAGSGLLVDAIALIATGRPAPLFVHPEDDTEMQKQITSLVLAGAQLAVIDNINGPLGCAALDAALTGRSWNQRVLGKSETARELPMRMVWLATANNVDIQADTARRLVHIRIESKCQNPEERTGFAHPNLRSWVTKERPRLVRAPLIVLRAYAVAGRPNMGLKPWGSFEDWSDWVRNALVWAGEVDPGETRAELAAQADTEGNALEMFLDAFEKVDPNAAGMTASQILHLAYKREEFSQQDTHPRLREAVEELCPTSNGKTTSSKSLGRRLLHLRRRMVGDRHVDRIGDLKKTNIWAVRKGVPQ